MSLKEMIRKVAEYQEPTVEDEKYQEGIDKLAAYVLSGMFSEDEKEEMLSKQAEEAMEKLSAEDKAIIRENIAYGNGMARGEVMGKEAGYVAGTHDMYYVAYEKAKELGGEEFAYKFAAEVLADAGVTQEDVDSQQEMEQVREHIVQSAAQQLVEAANIDPQNLTDEQKEQIIEIAEQAGDIGIQQLMEGGEGGEGGTPPKENK